MDALFSIRQASDKDKELIDYYAYTQGMDKIPDIQGIDVAVDSDDVAVGFIRIVHSNEGIAHVYPIVTYTPWQGFGVGRALIEKALDDNGELRLVSRGSSRGFYERLGFQECGWDMISPGLSEDCPNCGMREECDPVPMRKVKSDI